MTWFKIDDGFYSSRKVLSIPRSCRLAAVGLWTMAGNWSARELTDGVVPKYVLDEIGATPRLRRALVEARLWLDHPDGGIEFHSWTDYQPTRAHVEQIREKEREKKRAYRGTKQGVPEGVPGGHGGDSLGDSSTPVPTRPDQGTTDVVPVSPRKRGTRLPEGWKPSSETISKMADECPLVELRAEHNTFVDYWVAQPGQKGVKTDWDATWRNWMRRKQTDLTTRGARPTRTDQNLSVVARYAAAAEAEQRGLTA